MGANGSVTKEIVGGVTIGVPLVDEVTNGGVITALSLEQSVWLGMTYGAWFKLGLGIALVLLIVERSTSIYHNIKWRNKEHGRNSSSTAECTKGNSD